MKKWIADGVVVVTGGIISFSTKSLIPIGIAIIVVGVMLFILKEENSRPKQDISTLIQEYLNDVAKTMMEWLNTVQVYYDERVEELEKELVK